MITRSFDRALRSKVLFVKDGQVWTRKVTPSVQMAVIADVRKRHGDVPILNAMPRDEALKVYRELCLAF